MLPANVVAAMVPFLVDVRGFIRVNEETNEVSDLMVVAFDKHPLMLRDAAAIRLEQSIEQPLTILIFRPSKHRLLAMLDVLKRCALSFQKGAFPIVVDLDAIVIGLARVEHTHLI